MISNLLKRSAVILSVLTITFLLPEKLSAVVGDTFEYAYLGSTIKYEVLNDTTKTVKVTLGNKSITGDVVLPSTVYKDGEAYTLVEIGQEAFCYCALTSIVLPATVTKIGYSSFYGCSSLVSIKIPDSVTIIDQYAFSDCSSLASVSLSDSITSIGRAAFRRCHGLKSFTFPKLLNRIERQLLYNCNGLTSIVIPNTINSIGDFAFYKCENLESIIISNSVTSIEEYAFDGCSNLKNVTFEYSSEPITLANIFPNTPLENLSINRQSNIYDIPLTSVKSLVLGNDLVEIPAKAFQGWTTLESVAIGSALKEIPDSAFCGCALKDVVIPANIEKIGMGAFDGNQLTNVVIGCGTNKIGACGFANNDGVATVTSTAVVPPVATEDVFSTYTAQLTVMPESKEAYKNAPCWSHFVMENLTPIEIFEIVEEPTDVARKSAMTDYANKQKRLGTRVEPANASLADYVFWSSSNPDVATVDSEGLVTLHAKGTAEITARTLYSDVLASVDVTSLWEVNAGINSIYLAPSKNGETMRSNDIYNLQGICLKHNATQADIDALLPGFYIIAGKKVIIK